MKSSDEYQLYCEEKGITKSATQLTFNEMTLFFEWYREKIKEYNAMFGSSRPKDVSKWLLDNA